MGYAYEPGSAADFEDNLSTEEPVDTQDEAGAHLLKWEWYEVKQQDRPTLTVDYTTVTQTFYVTGEGDQVGDYTWVVTNSQDIGTVSEITGILYTITATATNPVDEEVTSVVIADIMLNEGTGETSIISWQISPQQE